MYESFFNLSKRPFIRTDEFVEGMNNPFSEKEIGTYVRARLREAGNKEQIFFSGAVRKIFFYSQGDPRLVDKLCDSAMIHAFGQEKKQIDDQMIDACMEQLREVAKKPVPGQRRKHSRININLDGAYFIMSSKQKGRIVVTDLSLGGVRIKMNGLRPFTVGDRVIITFNLDDLQRTAVRAAVIIRNVKGFFSGAEFYSLKCEELEKYIISRLEAP
jgi:hypothetical protein